VEIRDINLIKEKIVLENEKKIKLSKEINNLNLDYNEMIKIKKEEELKI
jgi:hypothetical protein